MRRTPIAPPKRGLFSFLATLVGRRTNRERAAAAVFAEKADSDDVRPLEIRRLSPYAEVNRFWNPAGVRKRAS